MGDNDAIETLRRTIDRLVGERQELRAAGAPREELEANRRALLAAQQQLAQALVARHSPSAA